MRPYALLAICALLAACSGSDDSTSTKAAASAPAVTGASTGLAKRPEFPAFYLDQINEARDPMNKPTTVPGSAPITMTGFAYDVISKKPAKAVDIVVDGVPYTASYGGRRLDVAQAQNEPGLEWTGFTGTLPAGALSAGTHSVTLRIVTNDGAAFTESPPIQFQVQ